MPGPARNAAYLDALRGNAGHRNRSAAPPTATTITDRTPPPDLRKEAQAVWLRDVTDLPGGLTAERRPLFRRYCRLRALEESLMATAEESVYAKKPTQRRPSPAVWGAAKIGHQADALWTQLTRSTPAAPNPNGHRNRLQAFLAKKRDATA